MNVDTVEKEVVRNVYEVPKDYKKIVVLKVFIYDYIIFLKILEIQKVI